MLQIPPKEWLEAGQQKLRAELGLDQPAPAPVNEGAVRRVFLGDTFSYRGVRFRAPPLPYVDGLRLQAHAQFFDTIKPTDADTPEVLAKKLLALDECAAILHRLARPVRWRSRLLWRLFKTPSFRDMSEGEFRDLAGFLGGSRMRSTVQLQSPSPATGDVR